MTNQTLFGRSWLLCVIAIKWQTSSIYLVCYLITYDLIGVVSFLMRVLK